MKVKPIDLVDVVDLLDAELDFVHGVQTAIVGLAVLNQSRREGVVELVECHLARLSAIRNKVNAARG